MTTPTTENPEKNSTLKSPLAGTKHGKLILLKIKDQTIRLDKERIVIGSVVSADVRLTGDGVAPIHAVIELIKGNVTIYDLASDTGVFINGNRIVMHPLKNDDEINVGFHKLKFNLEDLQKFSGKTRAQTLNPGEDMAPLLLADEAKVEEIFDYRPSQKQAIEVIMSWVGTIMDVQHFVDRPAITLGTTQSADFGIPPLLSEGKTTLVRQTADGFQLELVAGMKAVVQKQGELKKIVPPQGETLTSNFGKDDFVKVSVGDIDFYLSFTAAPPRLKPGRLFEKDALFFKIFASSAVLTIAIITALMTAHVNQALDAEQLPDRIATILYSPEKYAYHPEQKSVVTPEAPQPPVAKVQTPPPPVKLNITPSPQNSNKPIPKQIAVGQTNNSKATQGNKNQKKASNKSQKVAKEGAGNRAKGTEGSRGAKNAAAAKEKQTAALRPSPNGGKGPGGSRSQVGDEGNVDFLKSASGHIQDLLGSSSAKLGKGGEKLKGFGGFSTLGNGGLALSGDGKGGGGTADSLGGLTNHGNGGGRVGTGKGAAGNGSGIVGGATRVSIRTGGPEETVIMGAIDESAVEAAILSHKDEFRLCYEREINAEHPGVAGRIATNFVIGATGKVSAAGILETTLGSPNTERCVLTVIKRIHFPVPMGGGTVEVRYPFKFNATKGG